MWVVCFCNFDAHSDSFVFHNNALSSSDWHDINRHRSIILVLTETNSSQRTEPRSFMLNTDVGLLMTPCALMEETRGLLIYLNYIHPDSKGPWLGGEFAW